MSLFQCQHCGCCENTALAGQGCDGFAETFYDWTGFEDRKGKKLCSACAPTRFSEGEPTAFGKWHWQFDRVFLPMGMFRTARDGNLEHIETGDQDFRRYALSQGTTPKVCFNCNGTGWYSVEEKVPCNECVAGEQRESAERRTGAER